MTMLTSKILQNLMSKKCGCRKFNHHKICNFFTRFVMQNVRNATARISGPEQTCCKNRTFFRAPSKHVLKVKVKSTVSVEGNTASTKGNTISAKGNTISAKGNATSAKGNTVTAKGNTVSAKGNVFLSSERGLAMQ